VQRSLYVGRLQRGRAADLAAVLARRVKTGHVALIPVTDLRGALEVGTPPHAPLKPPMYSLGIGRRLGTSWSWSGAPATSGCRGDTACP